MPLSNVRKLSAILFADIVGYTALMHKDEAEAKRQIDKFRELFNTRVPQFQGEIIQYYGDACLCIFDSSVNALNCAIEIQSSFIKPPPVAVRIGLHSGDVYFDDDNVYGNSVNIASRIQSIGIPGSILFSERIKTDIQNHKHIKSSPLGTFQFKNVESPVDVFALDQEGFVIPSRRDLKRRLSKKLLPKGIWLAIGALVIVIALGWFNFGPGNSGLKGVSTASLAFEDKPSIAVLPFSDLSPDGDQEYFCKGLADELITYLSKISQLSVIARTSSFPLVGKTIKEISDILEVDFILDGSIKKDAEYFGITVNLINVSDGTLEWTETFDRPLKFIMETQRDIARTISNKMEPDIPDINNILKIKTNSYEAYDHYLKSMSQIGPEYAEQVFFNLNKALEYDPDFAEVHARKAWIHLMQYIVWNDIDAHSSYQEANRSIKKAMELKPDYSEFHLVNGAIKFYMELDVKAAKSLFEKAMGVNRWPEAPTSMCFCSYIHLLESLKKNDQALELMERVLEIDPSYFNHNYTLAWNHLYNNRIREARNFFTKGKEVENQKYGFEGLCQIAIYHDGDYEEAVDLMNEGMSTFGRYPFFLALQAIAYFRIGDMESFRAAKKELEKRYEEGEKKTSVALVWVEAEEGNTEKSLDYLEEAYELRESDLVDMNVMPYYNKLHSEKRFKSLIKKIGLE